MKCSEIIKDQSECRIFVKPRPYQIYIARLYKMVTGIRITVVLQDIGILLVNNTMEMVTMKAWLVGVEIILFIFFYTPRK